MTKHQKEIFYSMLEDESDIVFFSGPAGTGKSHTISNFIEELGPEKRVILTTTTHQSLSVLREMIPESHECVIHTATIHSFLNYVMQYNYNGVHELVHSDKPSKFDGLIFDYLFIDEATMLTPELLDHIKDKNRLDSITTKIILVGDSKQLKLSDFLNLESIPRYELSVNMRQNEDSDLYKYCKKLRQRIEDMDGPIPLPTDSDEIVLYKNHEDFIKAYKESKVSDKFIVAYKNATVQKYNNAIKKYMYSKELYDEGDNIIVLEPTIDSGKIIYPNRERVKIITTPIKGKFKIRINEKADFDYYEFETVNSKGKVATIKVPRTKSDYNATLEYYKEKGKKYGDWKPFYEFKEDFNFVHHSFAGTTHSAQGSTYDEVFIDLADFDPPNDPLNQTLLRLVYVAMTRARKRVHIFNKNEIRDFTKFKNKE
jgi:exodeoxyribonuclease-5